MKLRLQVLAMATLLLGCDAAPQKGGVTPLPTESVDPTWEYSEHKDEMRSQQSWTATLRSLNEPSLGFPYEGGSPVFIRLSKIAGDPPDNYAPEVVLLNGQFDCSQFGGTHSCSITVKVDDGLPYDLWGVTRDCGPNHCMRLVNANRMDGTAVSSVIDIFRKAKHLTVELPLYRFGSYQYNFSMENLDWSPMTDRQ